MSIQPVSCIIVDDNEVDRLATLSLVRKYSFLKTEGVYGSAESALAAMSTVQPEVIFLDIDMPGLSGLELREKLMEIPACIFVTAYPDYAVESFEKDALDFLVKPVKLDRFEKAMVRLENYLVLRNKASLFDGSQAGDAIFIKQGHERIKIHIHEVLYLEGLKDYTRIVTSSRKYCLFSSLGNLLKEQPFQNFLRIHRSYAVQKQHIIKVKPSSVMINTFEVPIGRTYKHVISDL